MKKLMTILTMVALLVLGSVHGERVTAISQVGCVPAPSGLVSWWPGDGHAMDMADANDGSLQDGATFGQGMVGQAFSFDGSDDFVRVEDDASLRLSKFTLSAWINATDVTSGGGIIAKTQALGNWLSYMIRLVDNGNVQLVVENRAESRYGHWQTLSTLTPNMWFHIAATWQNLSGDRTDAKIYVNGVEQMIEMSANQGYGPTFTPGYTAEPLFIGRQEVPSGGHFEGLIDEVDIYDRVLSASEIQAIHNAGSAGKCKGVTVEIDIKPGSFPNSINCRNQNGVIPVAILTTSTAAGESVNFDATTVDPLSVRFGRTGTEAAETHNTGHIEDADGDGDLDMVLHFRFGDTGIQCGDTQATLTGQTFDGQSITGTDSIRTVGG